MKLPDTPLASWLVALGVMLAAVAGARWVSLSGAIWLLAALSFLALREYYSLVDIRLEDRWGVLAGYAGIPLVFWLVQRDWYGFFIVSIPVYLFLVIPFLVAVGGRQARGAVFSIGAIDFGLFLFVYCLGHFAYVLRSSWPLAVLVALGAGLCDLDNLRRRNRRWRGRGAAAVGFGISLAACTALANLLAPAVGLPSRHAWIVGALLPVLVLMGRVTFSVLEADLGVALDRLEPGRGRYLDGLKPYVYAAPVIFHYVRYFTDVY